jgi:16S rRNA (adenine1518-N6/adenine1519-N6)-dimethyltransferase
MVAGPVSEPILLSRTRIHEILDRYQLAPSRALGQNFLCDGGMVRKIVALAEVTEGDRVVEIGAGLGSLTLGLCQRGARVLALEIDRHLIPPLTETTSGWPVEIHLGDARTFEWAAHLGQETWKVVANLPYNIATPLVLDLLATRPELTRWLVMVQREVGERLAAGPGSKTYGIPSVLVAYWGRARVVGSVRPELFWPRPKVESVLVEIIRSDEPLVDVPYERLSGLVRAGFGQRRKMLRGALAPAVTAEQLEQAGIAPTARAEELDLAAWWHRDRTQHGWRRGR